MVRQWKWRGKYYQKKDLQLDAQITLFLKVFIGVWRRCRGQRQGVAAGRTTTFHLLCVYVLIFYFEVWVWRRDRVLRQVVATGHGARALTLIYIYIYDQYIYINI